MILGRFPRVLLSVNRVDKVSPSVIGAWDLLRHLSPRMRAGRRRGPVGGKVACHAVASREASWRERARTCVGSVQ